MIITVYNNSIFYINVYERLHYAASNLTRVVHFQAVIDRRDIRVVTVLHQCLRNDLKDCI